MPKSRNRTGYAIAELPAVLYVLFVMLTFPLINLATVTLRYAFCTLAVQEAAADAAVSKTFLKDASPQDPSAVKSAQGSVTRALSRFTGITQKSLRVQLVTSNIDTGAVTRQVIPLSQPADTKTNLYMVEPELLVTVRPLIPIPIKGLSIPGLTGDLDARVAARKYCENPQGLNQ